jgi:hypothetical protein
MAGDWIKVRVNLPDDPAVFRMASAHGIPTEHVVGCLVRVWSWATDQLVNGHAVGVTLSQLDRVACVTGFGQSMADVGWLLIQADGIVFPRWERHLSQGAKQRVLATERKRRERVDLSRGGHVASVTETRPEKRREEKRIAAAAEAAVLPAAAISPQGGGEALSTLASFGIGRPALTEIAAGGLSVETITKICERCQAAGKGPGLMVWELKAAIDAQTATRPVADANRATLEQFRPVWAALGPSRLQAKEAYLAAHPYMSQYTGSPLEDLPKFQEWMIAKALESTKGKQ